ncbi:stress-induced protein [Pseudomonas sp. KU43P]|uniref:stress-induced protein n=1 Tax=Pseudomonas sp. KU43P TaxID=2487887 RepID=UPI0012A85405|nr:stress-induced protein [Pseudomonas sp. KU43P]BBH46740.1 hypothetical protein KU43P_32170 [Pseudomonas sp. KU43P]
MANDQGKGGQQGGNPQQTPEHVTNDPGQKGGQMPDDQWKEDQQRSGGGAQRGATGGHGAGSKSDNEHEQGMDRQPELDEDDDAGKRDENR